MKMDRKIWSNHRTTRQEGVAKHKTLMDLCKKNKSFKIEKRNWEL